MSAAIHFKPAARHAVSLLLGLSGGTGSGKTLSAMRIASALAGGKRFAVIDTENGRASFYADQHQFDVLDLRPPFTPQAYQDAITAADEAGYPVIVVDSASHSWAGEGGILDMQEAELQRMAGDDWKKREACRMASWIKPKMAHKKMMTKLLQVRAHVILCFRAEEKIEMVKNDRGKMEIVPKKSLTGLDGWIPICEKSQPFELAMSCLLIADRPGVPHPIKMMAQHREFIPLDKPLDESVGAALAKWAAGDEKPKPAPEKPAETVGTVGALLADYVACEALLEYDALEKRRREFWATAAADEKRQLKAASDAAAERLSEPPEEDEPPAPQPEPDNLPSKESVIDSIKAAKSRSACLKLTDVINTFSGQDKEELLELYYERMKALRKPE